MTGSDLDGRAGAMQGGTRAEAGRWPDRDQWAQAALTGTATALWYALPDHVPSRSARVWSKTGLVIALAAWSFYSDRSPTTDEGAPADPSAAGSAEPAASGPPESGERVTWRGVVAAVGFSSLVVGAVLGSLALTTVAERAIYRLGERAADRGVPYPHTRHGVVLGVVTGLLALVAGPDDAC